MRYPTIQEIMKLQDEYHRLGTFQSGGITEWKNRLREFFNEYHEYIFSVLISNVAYTEPTQEAKIETMEQVGERLLNQKFRLGDLLPVKKMR